MIRIRKLKIIFNWPVVFRYNSARSKAISWLKEGKSLMAVKEYKNQEMTKETKEYLYKKDFEIPLYRGKLFVILSNSGNKVREVVKEFDADDLYAHTYYFKYTEDKQEGERAYAIILNPDKTDPPVTNGTIAHESLHVANMIADIGGLIPDFNNDEPIAYLVQWIFDKVDEVIRKYNYEEKQFSMGYNTNTNIDDPKI